MSVDLPLWCLCPETLDEVLGADELAAIETLRELGDPTKHSAFWENVVARVLAGTVTAHGCPWDVELDGLRIEVKFATAFSCSFANGKRRVFKYASIRGQAAQPKACDVLVLIGYDNPLVYCWVVPYSNKLANVATISVPSERVTRPGSHNLSSFDKFGSSLTMLLPDVLRSSRSAPPRRMEKVERQPSLFA